VDAISYPSLIAGSALGWLVGHFLPGYLGEKGRNVATKEDISEITSKIESVKSEIRATAFEHEVRFSKLHERRAEVIAEIYKLLVKVAWESERLSQAFQWAGDPPRSEKYNSTIDAIAAYFRYFDQHRVFLPEALCRELDGFARKVRAPAIGYGVYLDIEGPTPRTKEETEQARVALQHFVTADVAAMRGAIENEFRRLLGSDH